MMVIDIFIIFIAGAIFGWLAGQGTLTMQDQTRPALSPSHQPQEKAMAARKAALVDLGAGYAKIDPARAETARIRLSIAIQQEYDGERDVLISRPQAIELYVTQAQAAELASALTGARFSAVPEEGRAFALSLAFDALKSAQGCIGPRRPGGSSEPQSEAYDHDAFMWDYYQRAIDALEEVLA